MSCNISVPIEDIAESVAQMLRQQFIEKDGGTGTGNTLTDTVLRGGLTFDTTAKQAICDAIERCVAEQIKESQAEQDADIDDKINAGDDRLEDKINGFEDRIDAGRIVGVTREDDTVTVKLANGNEFPFSITDSSSGGDRPVQFAPSSNGDNIEITLADGSVLDMTRQEFADWLAGDESPLTTDEELRNAVRAGKDEVLAELNERLAEINYDQATLKLVVDNNNNKTGKLVLENEDGTNSEVNLLSTDSGNLLEVRNGGLYLGDQVLPDLSGVNSRLDGLDNDVTNLDGRVTTLEEGDQAPPDLSGVNSRLDGLDNDVTSLDGRVTTLEEGGGVTGTGPGGTIDVEDLARSALTPTMTAYVSVPYGNYTPESFSSGNLRDYPMSIPTYGSINVNFDDYNGGHIVGSALFEIKLAVKQRTTINQMVVVADDTLSIYVNGSKVVTAGGIHKEVTYELPVGNEVLVQYMLTNASKGASKLTIAGDFIDNSNVKFA